MEVHGLPDNLDDLDFNSMSIGEDLVSNPAIFDTGASHGFTGSKSFLHNFCSLPKPIPVSVATNRANSFISGVGVRTPFGKDWQFCEGEITEDNIPSMYETIISVTGGLKDLPL
jgi:hypothetical protein